MLNAGFTIGDAPAETDAEAIARLAALQPLEYDRVREGEAERLGIRVVTLDSEVKRAREPSGHSDAQGRALRLDPPAPWPEPVDGATLLNALAAFLACHVFLPAGAADALACWTVHTYCFERFRHSPRVVFTSPAKRCGKTTALDALGLLVCKPLATANVTAAALFRTIEAAGPTLLIDEADTFLAENDDLRGVLNAGHKRGGQVIRCVGDDAEPRAFSVFGPAAIAAIGRLPGTIEDRAIIVRMHRAMRAERPAALDRKEEAEVARLAQRCARFAADHAERLAEAAPALPAELFNRAADNWRPLFAIAEAVGGDWPGRLAAASAALAPDDDDAEGRGIRLLADIRAIFAEHGADRIGSAELCTALVALESSPWAELNHGRPISPHTLARLLKQFAIRPAIKRAGADVVRGYERDAFAEAWRRYLPEATEQGANEPLQGYNPQKSVIFGASKPLQDQAAVTVACARKPACEAGCNVVTVQTPFPAEAGMTEVVL